MSAYVSVVVPVHNAEKVLADTMGNLIYQSIYERYGEGSLELLLVDDHSTDETPYILDDLHRQFPQRLRVIHLEENVGPGGARNRGMDAAQGMYVGFANCDDMADVSMFERLYETAVSNGQGVDFVDSPIYNESTGKTVLATPPEMAGLIDGNVKCNLLLNVGHMYTHLIKRELLEHHKIRTREHVASEDEDFLAEVRCRAKSFAVCQKPLYVHREGGKSVQLSNSEADNMIKPFSKQVSCALSAYGRLTSIEDYVVFKPGAEAFYIRRLARALFLYDSYKKEGMLTEDLDAMLLTTVQRAAETIVTMPVSENEFAKAIVGEKGRARLAKYLGI